MPEFIFTGAFGRHYPESRDALGVPIGTVEPGDTRDLGKPLDGDWLPTTPPDEKPKAKAPAKTASQPGRTPGTDTKAGVTGEEG